MELAKFEIEMVALLLSDIDEQHEAELSHLQLVMVGGGFGDAILA